MRLKDVAELVNEKSERTDLRYVALENVASWDGTFVETSATTDGVNNRFKRGDVLFGKLRPYLAKGFLPDFSGICSTEFFVLRPRKPLIGKYLLYHLLSPGFIDAISHQTAGVKMPRTDWSSFGVMSISLPPLPEQRRIVAFLDEKTASIDKRIALLERKRETLKRLKKSVIHQAVTRGLDPNVPLKESGVEWIGRVPARWNVRRGKDISRILRGVTYTPDDLRDESDGILLLRACNIQNSELIFENNVYVDNRLVEKDKRLIENDILICATNGSLSLVGKSAIVKHPLVASFGSFMLVMRTTANPRFVQYQLSQVVDLYRGMFGTTTINQISSSNLYDMQFLTPPLPEQRAIADYLDAECAKIDTMAQAIENQTAACRRLKRALIDEVVTGRRKVC